MKIEALEYIGLLAPVADGKAYGMSKALTASRQSTLVVLTLEDGSKGYGEAWGIPAVNKAYLPLLESYYLGVNVFDVEHVHALILARHYHFGIQNLMMAAISGIDIAAKDACGKLLDLPVSRLIGGRAREQTTIYASGGYFTATPEADFRPQIEAMRDAGYPAVKIKIGASPRSDESRLALTRELLGDDVEILVDINTNYTLDLACDSIERMTPYRIGWVEEPLSPQDFQGLRLLQRRCPVPIATGEALYTVFDFKRLTDARCADVLQPDLTLCGGFWQGRQIADLAVHNHVRLSPHVWGGAVGLAAALQFIASLSAYPHTDHVPHPPLLEYDLGENPLRDELLLRPLVPVDGIMAIPDGPGLGIDLDLDAVARYAVG